MEQTNMAGGLWSVVTVAGPILLALAIIFAMARNRRSRAEKAQSERAARDQHNAERRSEGVPPNTDPVSTNKN